MEVLQTGHCSGARCWGQWGGLKSSPEPVLLFAYCENPARWGSFRSLFSGSDGAGQRVPGSEVICSCWRWPGLLWAGWRGAFSGLPESQCSLHSRWLRRVWCGAPPAGFLPGTGRRQSPAPCPLSWLRFPWGKRTSEDVRGRGDLLWNWSVSVFRIPSVPF